MDFRNRGNGASDIQPEDAGGELTGNLAISIHDLRQSLQTLTLLEGLLMKTVEDGKARILVARMGPTLGKMAHILNMMSGINAVQTTASGLPLSIDKEHLQNSTLVKPQEQLRSETSLPVAVMRSLAAREALARPLANPVIFIVDDDSDICDAMRSVFEAEGQDVETYSSSEAFLAAYQAGREACLLIDAYLPGMNGLDLLKYLADVGDSLPAVMITGNSDVQMAVQAMKAGAIDFIEKPIGSAELIACVARAFEQSRDVNKRIAHRENAARHVASLTHRQREIMALVLAGHPSKNIAADLGISQRTVENHRAAIMTRMGAKSLPALARQALAAVV